MTCKRSPTLREWATLNVGIIIRARNAAEDLIRCLGAIRRQHIPDGVHVQVVVVDNDSEDETRVIGEEHGAQIVPIATDEFSWGRALNRGIAAVEADVAILLSADAIPADDRWLCEMIQPLTDEKVAAAYGRQEPRSDAPVDEVVRLRRAFDEKPRELTIDGIERDLASRRWVCSNACAAIRVLVWRRFQFDEAVSAAEEVPWIRLVLAAGYRAVYVPPARVLHSHRESVLCFAVRAWEFYLRDANVRPAPFLGPVRAVASIGRNRILNCASGQAGVRAVMVGLGRLPFECITLLALAAVSMWPTGFERMRRTAR